MQVALTYFFKGSASKASLRVVKPRPPLCISAENSTTQRLQGLRPILPVQVGNSHAPSDSLAQRSLWTSFSNERRTIPRNKSTALDPRCRSTFSATAAIISNPRVIWSLDINLSRKPLYLDSHGFPHQSHRLIPPPWRWLSLCVPVLRQ